MLPTGTITLLFTDIEGSTPLWEQIPTDMKLAVAQHHAILREVIEANGGQVFQILGDAFQAAFRLSTDGLCAAIQAQRVLQSKEWGATGPLKVRMGLHTGPVELDPLPGPTGVQEYTVCHTLNRAARVMSAGYGGQILVSQETKSLIERDLPDGVRLRDLGQHQLKGMRRLEHIYQVIVEGLPQDFPVLATGVTHPNNLPVEMTSFVGREKEIAELIRMLGNRSTRLVTVTGAGGMGKTRLALQAADGMLDLYVDGVWLVELVSLSDPILVPQAVAQTLNIRELPGHPVMEVLEEYLSKKHLLLILDNCEHLTRATSDLASRLLRTCPHLQIMATSREILGVGGEITYLCPSLLPPNINTTNTRSPAADFNAVVGSAAVQLFTERALIAFPGFRVDEKNASIVSGICQQLDGIPLAIELAAARVRLLSVEQIANRLDNAFQLLTGGSSSALPHHRTLKALIDWSYDLLTPTERTILLRLSVFAGGWDLDAAEAVGGAEEIETWQVLDLMTQLLDKSLILVDATVDGKNRYRMLETIRQYAYDLLLGMEGYPAVRKRHLEYFSRMAEEAAPRLWDKEQGEWSRRLAIEKDNLRGALHWALSRETAESDEIESGARMAAALWNYWYLYGVMEEGVRWLAVALQRSPQQSHTRARLLSAEGTFAWQQGNLPAAASRMRESLNLFSLLEDTSGLAEATHMYGHIVFDQQNYTEAERVFKESLSIYESLGDSDVRIALIGDLGMVACHQGDLSLARGYYEQSLTLSIQNGVKDCEARSYILLGDITRQAGDYKKAEELYEKSLRIFRNLNISREIACTQQKLGFIAIHRGEINQAQVLFRESLALQHEAGNQQGVAECLAGLASVMVMKEEDEEAAIYFGAAIQILTRTGLPMAPADMAEWERDEAVARSRCNPQCFEQARAKGSEAAIKDLVAALLASRSPILSKTSAASD
jgi:predicted ATPase/class 3 adenylate cyclase